MPPRLVVHAPAKINLALHVTGRRDDGYHQLDSLVVFTRFGDTVDIEDAAEDSFAVSGTQAGLVPASDGNLVTRARDLLRALHPERATGSVAIHLDKRIPVAAGVGGGSSDAASVLRALATRWQMEFPEAELRKAALRLGADLPMCLAARPLIARGIGDEIEELDDFPRLPLVLLNPRIGVATADVFAGLSSRESEALPPLPRRRDIGSVAAWLAGTRNDLERPAAAIAPVIGTMLAELRGSGCLIARMSGSGATCYGMFADMNDAEDASDHIRSRHPDWFVTATMTGGAGDDPHART